MSEKQLKKLVNSVRETADRKAAYTKVANFFILNSSRSKRISVSNEINRQEADNSVKIEHP